MASLSAGLQAELVEERLLGVKRAMWPEKCRRVVFVVTRTPTMDGVNSVLRILKAELVARGVEVSFISLHPGMGDPLGPTLTIEVREELHRRSVFRSASGVKSMTQGMFLVPFKRVDRWWSNFRYRRIMEALGEETLVVFTHVWPKTRLDETGYRRPDRGPLFVGQHHSSYRSVRDFPPMADEHRTHFADLDSFVALTDEDAAGFADLLPSVDCVSIPNPTPRVVPVVSGERLAEAVYIGRYSPEKRMDFMIRAFIDATRDPELEHWRLKLYGSGDAEPLHRAIAELGAGGRVRVMGRADDVPAVLARASLNLLASVFEGWPMAVVEAAQAGVPTVSFDSSPGVRALVTPATGWLVPNADEAAYVSALREAITSPRQVSVRGEAARELANRFDASAVVDRWCDVVQTC